MTTQKLSTQTGTLLFLGLFFGLLLAPAASMYESVALAQESSSGVQIVDDLQPEYAINFTKTQGTRESVVNIILQLIAGSLIYAAGPIAVVIIAIGGMRYVIGHGDPTKIEEAKKTIVYAIVGLILIILSWAIVVNVINILSLGDPMGTDAYDPSLGY